MKNSSDAKPYDSKQYLVCNEALLLTDVIKNMNPNPVDDYIAKSAKWQSEQEREAAEIESLNKQDAAAIADYKQYGSTHQLYARGHGGSIS